MGKRWKVLPNCTFRTEDDGTGFVFNADNDALHPVNQTAVEVMKELSAGASNEDELFERLWPRFQELAKGSIREDLRAFLLVLADRGCVAAEGNQTEENEAVAQAGAKFLPMDDMYYPPLLEELGRRPRPDADPDIKPRDNEERLRRRRFLTVGAGALAAMILRPQRAEAEVCSATGTTPITCTPTGNTPPEEACLIYGTAPNVADCWDYGSKPNNYPCFTGFYPTGGGTCDDGLQPVWECLSTGSQPSGVEGWCDTGTRPVQAGCESTGSLPSVGVCSVQGYHPSLHGGCEPNGISPGPWC